MPWLVDAARYVRSPDRERKIWRDYLRFRRATRPLRELPAEGAGKTVLVLSLADSVYQVKLEGMLAWALRDMGWSVAILTTSRRNTIAQRYFRCFGFEDFVFQEDYPVSAELREQCASASTRLMSGDLAFGAVKGWRYRGMLVGPQLLSSISRSLHEGAPDTRDPGVQAQLRELLPATLARVHQAEAIIGAVRPSLALVIEANYVTYGPFVDGAVSAGVPVIQILQPWKDDGLIFKRLTHSNRRVHAASVELETLHRHSKGAWTPVDEEELRTLFADRYGGRWTLQNRNQRGTRRIQRDDLVRRLGIDPDKKNVVVFSHILWDANLFYGEDIFEDYGDWFVQTVLAAVKNSRVNWLFKLHPANVWKRARDGAVGEYSEERLIRRHVGDLPPHVRLIHPDTDISTFSLFELADFGVTVRGTAGMELPCFGVPTYTAGTGRYAGLGFTIDSAIASEYLARMAALPAGEGITDEQVALAKKHALLAFVRRQWKMVSFRGVFAEDFGKANPLDANLVATFSTLDEVRRNGDLRRWAHWAAGSTEVDYVETAW